MQIMKFKTTEEVLQRANNTTYGLAAGIFTNDMKAALTLSRGIHAGTGKRCIGITSPANYDLNSLDQQLQRVRRSDALWRLQDEWHWQRKGGR
jgi:hypothetical protein